MHALLGIIIIFGTLLFGDSANAGQLCSNPDGFDLLQDPPVWQGEYDVITPKERIQIIALSEPEMIRIGEASWIEAIDDSETLLTVANTVGVFNRDGVRAVLGYADTKVRLNGPTLFVVAKDAKTDGKGYFEFRNFYMVPANVDGEVEAAWVISSPMIAQLKSSGLQQCACDTDSRICAKKPGGNPCPIDFPDCNLFSADILDFSQMPGPIHHSIVDQCSSNERFIDSFGNEIRGAISHDAWLEKVKDGLVDDFYHCEMCKEVLVDCEGFNIKPGVTPPPGGDCMNGGSNREVSLICQQAMPKDRTGFCGLAPAVPGNIGPYCIDGAATGGLGSLSAGMSPVSPAEMGECRTPLIHDYCTMVDADPVSDCFEPRNEFWLQFSGCADDGVSSSPSDFECLGTSGMCKIGPDGTKFCTDCTGDQCVQWVERGLGDPRRFDNSTQSQTDGTTTTGNCALMMTVYACGIQDDPEPETEKKTPAETAKKKEMKPTQPQPLNEPDETKVSSEDATKAVELKKENIAPSEEPKGDGDPVIVQTGELLLDSLDIALSGPVIPLEFKRSYASQSDFKGVLGSNWTHNYETRLQIIRPGNAPGWASAYCGVYWPHATCLIRHHEHSQQLYVYDPVSGRFVPHLGTATSHVVDKGKNGFVLFDRDGSTETFNAYGHLTRREDRFGNGVEVTLEPSPLGLLHRRYCVHKPQRYNDPDEAFGLDPLICSYLSFAVGDQSAELLARGGWTADSPLVLPPDDAERARTWEYIKHSGVAEGPAVLMDSADYKSFASRANYFLQLMLQLGYMVEPATGPAHYRVKTVRELRHNRTFHFHYHNEVIDPSVVQNTTFGLLKKVTVNASAGWGVEFEYFRPDLGSEFNEYFLTRAKKIYKDQPDLDNSDLLAHASNQAHLDHQYTYLQETQVWSEFESKYFEHFENIAGCAVVSTTTCLMHTKSILDGNPCHLTHLEKLRFFSDIVDNITTVHRAGELELESEYVTNLHSDEFDRVVLQRYGGRIDAEFSLNYVEAGPFDPYDLPKVDNEKVARSALLPASLLNEFPLEVPTTEAAAVPASYEPPCSTEENYEVGSSCYRYNQPVDHGGTIAAYPGTCGPNHRHELPEGTVGKECKFNDEAANQLPHLRPTFEYFQPDASTLPPVWRTYLTCDQLAAKHLYDVRSSGTVGSAKKDANGVLLEDWSYVQQKRDAIELDLRRICTWAKTTDREGTTKYYGLNFRAQALVEAVQLNSGEVRVDQRIFNADGKLQKEWDTRELTTPLTHTAYTAFEYDTILPDSENGWGKRWPSPWATRHNLLREEYHPSGPVFEFDETQKSTSLYKLYRWEPLFNQIRYMEYGKVIGGVDVPVASQSRIFDYQEFSELAPGLIYTNNNQHPFVRALIEQIALGRHWSDGFDSQGHFLDNSLMDVFEGAQTIAVPKLTGYFLQGVPLQDSDLNGDGFYGTQGEALGLPVVVIDRDHTITAANEEVTVLAWTPNGQMALLEEPTGVRTQFDYHPKGYNQWMGSTPPDPAQISNGNTGKLAKVSRNQANIRWSASEMPPDSCQSLEGPYGFLGSCLGGAANLLDSLGLPASVKSHILDYNTSLDVTEYRYASTGQASRTWKNGLEVVHWNDADGRPVRIVNGNRETRFKYTAQAWVYDKRGLEDGHLVSHETFAHDRYGNVVGHCKSRTGTSCTSAFAASFAIGDPSPAGTSRTLFAYDKEDRLSHKSDPLGYVTYIERDEYGRVIREVTPDCVGASCSGDTREVRIVYDVLGQVVAKHYGSAAQVQQLGGGSEYFAYDAYRRLVTHIDRRLNTWQMAWNKADQLRAKMIYGLAFPAPLQNGEEVTVWTYGPFGRVESEVVDPEGIALATQYAYARGSVPYMTGSTGYAPVYTSTDAKGRPLVKVDEGHIRVWTYSNDGLEATESTISLDESGFADTTITLRSVADRHGLPILKEETNALDEVRSWAFSRTPKSNGWEFAQMDPAGRTTSRIDDLVGFTVQDEVATPQGTEITHFTVNARGEKNEILDASGGVTTQVFNGYGERTYLEKPSPTNDDIHHYGFDAYGRLSAWTRHGETVSWTWDARGDLHQELVTVGTNTEILSQYSWDDAGRRDSTIAFNPEVRDSLGLSAAEAKVDVNYTWDGAGRLLSEEISSGQTSRVVFRDWTINSQGTWEVHTEEMGLGGFSRTTTLDQLGRRVYDQTAFSFPSSTVNYAWSGGRITQRVHNGNVGFDSVYNGFGERVTQIGTGPHGVFHKEQIERDVLGRVRSQVQTSPAWVGQERWQGFEYDARHALSTSWDTWAPSASAPSVGTHDSATNLTVQSAANTLGAMGSIRDRASTLGSLQRITQGSQDVWEAQRSSTGHRLIQISDQNATWTIQNDALGRVTAAIDKEFEYNPLGKLVLARDTNGELLESYLLTADGRIAQVQRHEGQAYKRSVFTYDGAQMTASFTEGSGSTWSQDWQAVWGPGQDQLIEFHDFHAGKTLVVAQDHRNNVVALFDDVNEGLDRVMHYTPEGLSTHYDRHGQVLCDEETSLTVTCTTLNMPFGFNGMWRSNTTGLSFMRNRWYSPQLGQFMSHDPLEYVDSYDLYAFAKLDPINFWDPWGLESWTVIKKPWSPKSKSEPKRGKLTVYFVSRELEGWRPYFNHTYLLIYGQDIRLRVEGGRGANETSLDFSVSFNSLPGEGSPFLEEPEFQEMWDSGEIEGLARAEVDDDGRLQNLMKVRNPENLRLESKYKADPEESDEANCHTVCATALNTLGLNWPEEFDNFEHHGRDHINEEIRRIVEPDSNPKPKPEASKEESQRSKQGLAE